MLGIAGIYRYLGRIYSCFLPLNLDRLPLLRVLDAPPEPPALLASRSNSFTHVRLQHAKATAQAAAAAAAAAALLPHQQTPLPPWDARALVWGELNDCQCSLLSFGLARAVQVHSHQTIGPDATPNLLMVAANCAADTLATAAQRQTGFLSSISWSLGRSRCS